MKLNSEQVAEWQAYVLKCYPEEAVAYIINDSIYPVKNASPTPLTDFAITQTEQLAARKIGTIQALLHSHPYTLEQSTQFTYDPSWPSGADMQNWIGDNIPWGIVATDGSGLSPMVWLDDNAPEPLIGREFVHGVNDCYSIIRDYFKLNKGITLKNFARSMDWWNSNDDLYLDNFKAAGFVEITEDQVTTDDCVLMAMFGDKISHAAVIIDNDKILHHKMKRLSGTESLSKWRRQVVKYVRYIGVKDEA